MQDRYVGDLIDFAKYGMLLQLADRAFRLGVVWCLTQDTDDQAGHRTRYLEEPLPTGSSPGFGGSSPGDAGRSTT